MKFRPMQPDDYDAMMRLWCDCDGLSLRDADSRTGLAKYLQRNPGLSFVAIDDERLIATVMAGHDGRRGYIQHVAVARDRRRRGIAGRLLELSLEALLHEGIAKSHVHALRANAAGCDYWRRLGWIERDEVSMYSYINGDNPNV